jgi:hypothetical protein
VSAARQGYEQRDAHLRPLLFFAAGLVALVAASFVVTWWLTAAFGKRQEQALRPHPMSGFRRGPEGPVLQATPNAELDRHRAEEQARLEGYGWIDRTNGVVHVPIERAMELLLERGLPTRPAQEERAR